MLVAVQVGGSNAHAIGLTLSSALKKWLFVKSCGWILTQNEGESPVDRGFMCIYRRSEFARESEMIPACNGWRRREAGPGHFNKAAAFA
jgi:hypothetical protein